MAMGEHHPRVSIGIPVYNGEAVLGRALDSLLAQTFTDFEIVVADNASEDGTQALCEDYARRDPRVRYFRNETNLGQIANFNRAFELSRGAYFRWAGCNDWWDARYLERCCDALDGCPDAILVSCYHEYVWSDGRRLRDDYEGQRVDSPLPHKRFARMLWFLRASRFYFDPIYSMMRRSALERTVVLRPIFATDLALAAELSLVGPFCHVPECLVYQSVTVPQTPSTFLRRFDPKQSRASWWFLKLCRCMAGMILAARISAWQKVYCFGALGKYIVKQQGARCWAWARRTVALRTRLRGVKAALSPNTSPTTGGSD
jgi:glycosyltransferase involved in cell wall biosynthesis